MSMTAAATCIYCIDPPPNAKSTEVKSGSTSRGSPKEIPQKWWTIEMKIIHAEADVVMSNTRPRRVAYCFIIRLSFFLATLYLSITIVIEKIYKKGKD